MIDTIGQVTTFLSLLKKIVDGVKDQIMSLFKTKDYNEPERFKAVYGGGKKQAKEKKV